MRKIKELRYIVKSALKNEYGFEPTLRDTIILESNETGTYILFRVNGRHYKFLSKFVTIEGIKTIWTGNGTIKKIPEYDKI